MIAVFAYARPGSDGVIIIAIQISGQDGFIGPPDPIIGALGSIRLSGYEAAIYRYIIGQTKMSVA